MLVSNKSRLYFYTQTEHEHWNTVFARVCSLQENSLGMDGAIFIATALRGNHQLTYIKSVCVSVCLGLCVNRRLCLRGSTTGCHDSMARVVNILQCVRLWIWRLIIYNLQWMAHFMPRDCSCVRFDCDVLCFSVSVSRVTASGSRGQRSSRMPSKLVHQIAWWISSTRTNEKHIYVESYSCKYLCCINKFMYWSCVIINVYFI